MMTKEEKDKLFEEFDERIAKEWGWGIFICIAIYYGGQWIISLIF